VKILPRLNKKLILGVLLVVLLLQALILLAFEENIETNAVEQRWNFLPGFELNPYNYQIKEQIAKLNSPSVSVRAGAAEALGYLRAYSASSFLIAAIEDPSSQVRREAALSLAWCGDRNEIAVLLKKLDDEDWLVRQSAWAALTNLTGLEMPFDALASVEIRQEQTNKWYHWWSSVPQNTTPQEVLQLMNSKNDEERLRGVRALGSLGGEKASTEIIKVLEPFKNFKYESLSQLDKHLVQSCLHSLGRLRQPEAFSVIMSFFNNKDWARHAAGALADFADQRAVKSLIQAYPKYARPINNKQRPPQFAPRDDRHVGDNMQDRMYETAYAIAFALSRLPLDDVNDISALRKIGPWLVSNLPSDYDGAMIYDVEADQLITAFLLEKCGLRQLTCDIAFNSAEHPENWIQIKRDAFDIKDAYEKELLHELSLQLLGDVPYMAAWIPAFCRKNDVPNLTKLLDHKSGWIRINAAKALMFNGVTEAIDPIAKRLANSHPEVHYGFSGALEHSEYNDPTPRWREAFIRALGRLGAVQYIDLLISCLEDEQNVLDIQYAAAFALDDLGTPKALESLERAARNHPFHSVRLVAREGLWRRNLSWQAGIIKTSYESIKIQQPNPDPKPQPNNLEPEPGAIVFIKGNNKVRSDFNGQAGVDPWRQTYVVTNSGPTMRVGRNLYVLHPARPDGEVFALTNFEKGFVADCEVSWDGNKIIFARRLNDEERNYSEVPYQKAELKEKSERGLGGLTDPWWHIWEINSDGTNLRQLTYGPFHDVAPAYLPDGRIVFSSSRIGLRDEYHGYPAVGISVMNADGSDIHPIGFNLGGDRDPSVMFDGRIVFSRLDNFYSRLKTEVTVQSIFPDGTKNVAFYGPERRPFWREVHKKNAAWTLRECYEDRLDNRNRVLRIAQPQPLDNERIICASSGGLVICGPGPYKETLVPHDRKMAVTSPFPLDSKHILCAATPKEFNVNGKVVICGTPEFEALEKGPELFRSATNIDLALYSMDIETGEMKLLYNDPNAADFEARPIKPRKKPITLAEHPSTRSGSYTATLFCNSAKISREERVRTRARFVRVVEGQPIVSRHESQQNRPLPFNDQFGLDQRWKNHGGTIGRILGTIPLAADGSFCIEVPADRLIHLQVLDSDRRVLGNQVFWLYARPGETRSCVGCHEPRNITTLPNQFALAGTVPPVKILPTGGEFTYLAKAWMKGYLPDETEERTRTVHAINLIGRY
jgi:HEAT repeat protein